jgi:nucleobase:cation symporter-1, NCS1 family
MAFPRLVRPPEWGVEPVPPEKRTLGAFDLFVLWSSLGVGLLVLAAGSLLVNLYGLNLVEVVAVTIVGSVAGSLLLAAAARHGAAHGVPTMVSLRPILGRRGALVPSFVNAFQLLGWAAFELLVMGLAAAYLVHDFLGPLTAVILIPVAGLLVLALAWLGPLRVIRSWLERFAFWIMLATTVLIAYSLVNQPLWLIGEPRDLMQRYNPSAYQGTASLFLGLDLVIVMPISWWPLVADYNRFARSGRASAVGTTAGFAASNIAFYTLGAALALFVWADPSPLETGWADYLVGLNALSLGGTVLLIILVDETDNAFANVYSTAVSLQNARPKRRQLPLIVAATAIATVGALALASLQQGLGGPYELFLLGIGGVFVPLLGVVIADSFVVRRSGYSPDEFAEGAPTIRAGALVAWAFGMVLYFSVYLALIPGFPPIGATLPSFGIAAGLHILLCRLEKRRATPPAAEKTPG